MVSASDQHLTGSISHTWGIHLAPNLAMGSDHLFASARINGGLRCPRETTTARLAFDGGQTGRRLICARFAQGGQIANQPFAAPAL